MHPIATTRPMYAGVAVETGEPMWQTACRPLRVKRANSLIQKRSGGEKDHLNPVAIGAELSGDSRRVALILRSRSMLATTPTKFHTAQIKQQKR